MNTVYDVNKPYYKASGGSSSSSTVQATPTQEQVGISDFVEFENQMYEIMNSDPSTASQYIVLNKDAIIAERGKAVYNKLYKAAQEAIQDEVNLRKLL